MLGCELVCHVLFLRFSWDSFDLPKPKTVATQLYAGPNRPPVLLSDTPEAWFWPDISLVSGIVFCVFVSIMLAVESLSICFPFNSPHPVVPPAFVRTRPGMALQTLVTMRNLAIFQAALKSFELGCLVTRILQTPTPTVQHCATVPGLAWPSPVALAAAWWTSGWSWRCWST